ncbi:MAG: hypothetical protein EBR82_49445, partial [Caulobacteraceae bacterium]|nr:hypothetical protein [Caulobacteraceae bacterium]
MDVVQQGPGNTFIVPVNVEVKDDEAAILDIVQYNDYLCSDARNEAEVEWRARRAFLSRYQAETLFGKEIANGLSYDSFPEAIKKDFNRDREKYEGKAEVYEIWCKSSEKVYWIQTTGEKTLLMESEPPIDFEKFFPCVVIAQNVDPDSVIPVSDYTHCKDQILEIERLTTRIHAVTQAIRTNALYDSSMGAQVEQLMIGDLKMIPTINWNSHKGRGGLQNAVEFMPIEPYVNALQTLQTARQTALQQLYETLKVSDLLRGTSAEYKTATANRLESAWSSLGLIVRQNMFTKFISDAIGNLGTIIMDQFEEAKIMNCGDAEQVLSPLIPPAPPAPPMDPNLPPEAQPPMPPPVDPALMLDVMKKKIMALYKDDDQFNYRIQIASDSMVAIDQAQDQQEGQALIGAAGEFFNQMRALIEQYPPLLEFSISLFQNVIKRYKGGKELDGLFSNAFAQIGEISKAKQEAALQPPPPDPKMIEMQGRMQIAQTEAQARLQTAQMEAQDRHDKNILAYQDQQLKMQRDQLEAQLAVQKQQFEEYAKQQEIAIAQQEIQVKTNAVQVDMLKVQAMSQSDTMKHEITQENNRLQGILKVQELEAKQMEFRLSQQEKLMEERRLASEQQIEMIRMHMEQMKPSGLINMGGSSGKKSGKIITDENGNPTAIAPSGVTISGTPNVAVTNTPSVTVSGTPNVAVTSSVVPTGAATSANQTSGNTSLASIDGKLPALSAGKLPVDTGLTQPLTDTQLRASAVPVSISGTPNVNVSNTSVPVAPVTGTIFDINAVGELIECLEAMRQYQASLTRTIG